MTHALPVSSPFADVDPKRVAANAAVVALHALVFAVLMLPSRRDGRLARPARQPRRPARTRRPLPAPTPVGAAGPRC